MKTLTRIGSAALIAVVAASTSAQADLFTDVSDIWIWDVEWALPGTNDPNSEKIMVPIPETPDLPGVYWRINYAISTYIPLNGNTYGPEFNLFVDSSDADAPILRPYGYIGGGFFFAHAWYGGVETGTLINAEFRESTDPFYFVMSPDTSGEIALTEKEPFYMAFIIDSIVDQSIPDVYGWMELEYAGSGELNLLRSAAQNNGTSIVVGQIPEPSSVLLLLLGGGGVALLRRHFRI